MQRKCAHWRTWWTRGVLHACTTCPSSAKELTTVHCAPGLHSVTELQFTVHCHCCALCKHIVHSAYTVCHEGSCDNTCPNDMRCITTVRKMLQMVHACRTPRSPRMWRPTRVHHLQSVSLRVPIVKRTLQQCTLHMSLNQSRNSGSQGTALFVHYPSAQCTSTTVHDISRVGTGHVPATRGALKKS